MSLTFGSRSGSSPEINVTPMIDVLLVLLIIFMVLFPYQSVGERAEIPLSSSEQPIPPPVSPIVIQIRQATGSQRPTLRINEEEIPWDNLEARLQKISSVHADKVAFLKGDPEIDFQFVADVIDVAHRVGVERLGLMGSEPTSARN